MESDGDEDTDLVGIVQELCRQLRLPIRRKAHAFTSLICQEGGQSSEWYHLTDVCGGDGGGGRRRRRDEMEHGSSYTDHHQRPKGVFDSFC